MKKSPRRLQYGMSVAEAQACTPVNLDGGGSWLRVKGDHEATRTKAPWQPTIRQANTRQTAARATLATLAERLKAVDVTPAERELLNAEREAALLILAEVPQDKPDGRMLSAMKPERRVLHHLIDRWLAYRCNELQFLQLPRESIYTRPRIEVYSRIEPAVADSVIATDQAIAMLRPHRQKVLLSRYVNWTGYAAAAKACKLSEAEYERQLASVHEALLDWLSPLIQQGLRDLNETLTEE